MCPESCTRISGGMAGQKVAKKACSSLSVTFQEAERITNRTTAALERMRT